MESKAAWEMRRLAGGREHRDASGGGRIGGVSHRSRRERAIGCDEGWYDRWACRLLCALELDLAVPAGGASVCIGVNGSLADFLSEIRRGDEPSGMTGSACAIVPCNTWFGLFFFCSLTVDNLLTGTGFRLGDSSAPVGGSANLTLDGICAVASASFCLRWPAMSGFKMERGRGRGREPSEDCFTYDRGSDRGSSIDVRSRTAAALLAAPKRMSWSMSSSYEYSGGRDGVSGRFMAATPVSGAAAVCQPANPRELEQ